MSCIIFWGGGSILHKKKRVRKARDLLLDASEAALVYKLAHGLEVGGAISHVWTREPKHVNRRRVNLHEDSVVDLFMRYTPPNTPPRTQQARHIHTSITHNPEHPNAQTTPTYTRRETRRYTGKLAERHIPTASHLPHPSSPRHPH